MFLDFPGIKIRLQFYVAKYSLQTSLVSSVTIPKSGNFDDFNWLFFAKLCEI